MVGIKRVDFCPCLTAFWLALECPDDKKNSTTLDPHAETKLLNNSLRIISCVISREAPRVAAVKKLNLVQPWKMSRIFREFFVAIFPGN